MSQDPTAAERGDQYNEYYSSRKPGALGERALRWWHRRMLHIVAQAVPDLGRRTLLEVGAGSGYFADACRERGVAYSGIEMNAAQAGLLRARGHDVVAGAVPPFPPGAPVDVIYASHVLEHASDYLHARAMLAGAAARLAPGGYVVVVGPDVLAWKEEFWNVDWSHGYPTSLHRVEQLLEDVGLESVRALHHTAGTASPVLEPALSTLLGLVPYAALDAAGRRLLDKRYFFRGFMTTFGWRQCINVARKPAGASAP